MSLYRYTFLDVDSPTREGVSFHTQNKHLGYFFIEIDRSHPFQEVNKNWLQDEDIGHWICMQYINLGKYYFGFCVPPTNENSGTMISSIENVEGRDVESMDGQGCNSTTRIKIQILRLEKMYCHLVGYTFRHIHDFFGCNLVSLHKSNDIMTLYIWMCSCNFILYPIDYNTS